jgi:hypothetical protein
VIENKEEGIMDLTDATRQVREGEHSMLER